MNEEKHICVYCGHEAHYQFKNGKWCCAPYMNGCPEIKRQRSETTKRQHELNLKYNGSIGLKKGTKLPDEIKRKKKSNYPTFSGEHICVHCGQYAEYKLKNGHWCCQPTASKCPEVKKRYANKPETIKNRDYKATYQNLPEETKQRMKKAFVDPISREKGRQTLIEGYRSGKIIPSFKGKKHKPESIDKIRISTVKYFEEVRCTGGAKFSKRGCEYMDKLNESRGWHLQHGMNGGEVIVGGYYLDGYDKDLNIAFEYDEAAHYIDVQNNILKEKDIRRMNYIHERLGCRFFRYNERKDYLYEVDFSIIST